MSMMQRLAGLAAQRHLRPLALATAAEVQATNRAKPAIPRQRHLAIPPECLTGVLPSAAPEEQGSAFVRESAVAHIGRLLAGDGWRGGDQCRAPV